MSNTPEDFENLRKLLKLMRHEQPPPGYFDQFSCRVISRLESEEAGLEDNSWSGVPWFQKLLGFFETNPLATGVVGVGFCGLLVAGLVFSQSADQAPMAFVTSPNGAYGLANSTQASVVLKQSGLETSLPSTGAVFNTSIPGNSMFGGGNLNIQPVSFSPAGR